jgi:hypothetical protein
VSDPTVRITTTMSIYHRVDTTFQTEKYVLQQQCLIKICFTFERGNVITFIMALCNYNNVRYGSESKVNSIMYIDMSHVSK